MVGLRDTFCEMTCSQLLIIRYNIKCIVYNVNTADCYFLIISQLQRHFTCLCNCTKTCIVFLKIVRIIRVYRSYFNTANIRPKKLCWNTYTAELTFLLLIMLMLINWYILTYMFIPTIIITQIRNALHIIIHV